MTVTWRHTRTLLRYERIGSDGANAFDVTDMSAEELDTRAAWLTARGYDVSLITVHAPDAV